MELQMEEADTKKRKIDAVKAKEMTGLTMSRQVISTPGLFKNTAASRTPSGGSGNGGGGDTPRRTPMRLGL